MTTQSLSLATRANLRVSHSDEDLSTLTDEQLIHCLKSGRNEAMTHLFDRYYVEVQRQSGGFGVSFHQVHALRARSSDSEQVK